MSKSKTVQIESKLFFELYEYFCKDNDEVDLEYIKSALSVKYDRIQAHTLYTMSKNPRLPEDQREYFRTAYLDHKGVPEDFRK